MRALDFAIEVRRALSDVDVRDVLGFQVPVELGLELGAIVPSECEVKAGQVLL